MPAIDLDAPIPTDKELRETGLQVLRSIAINPGTAAAVRADAAEALRKHDDQTFALLQAAEQLTEEERRVLVAIGRRLAMGHRHYGPLDVHGDRRDWRAESAEELLDATVYLACEAMRRGTP